MKIRQCNPRALEPHPLHKRIYGAYTDRSPEYEKMGESIRKFGIIAPLIITKELTIVSGRSRWHWARKLGMDSVPCVTLDKADSLDIEEALIESNRQRIKGKAVLAREAAELARIESEKAKQRKVEAGKKYGRNRPKGKVEKLVSQPIGRTKQKVGDILGVSGPTASKLADVGNALKEAEAAGDTKRVEEIEAAVNKSVAEGHRLVKPKKKKQHIVFDTTEQTVEVEESLPEDPEAVYWVNGNPESWEGLSDSLKQSIRRVIDAIGDDPVVGKYIHRWLHGKNFVGK